MASTQSAAEELTASLLARLRVYKPSNSSVNAYEIAYVVSLIFNGQLDPAQMEELLSLLYTTNLDHDPEVIAKCAARMRAGATPVDIPQLAGFVASRNVHIGKYCGGPV